MKRKARPERMRLSLWDDATGATPLELPERRMWPAALLVAVMFAMFAGVEWTTILFSKSNTRNRILSSQNLSQRGDQYTVPPGRTHDFFRAEKRALRRCGLLERLASDDLLGDSQENWHVISSQNRSGTEACAG